MSETVTPRKKTTKKKRTLTKRALDKVAEEKKATGRVEFVDTAPEKPAEDKIPQTQGEKVESDKFKKAFEKARKNFHSRWEGEHEVIDRRISELKQIKSLLEPYLAKVFGGDHTDYIVGFFTESDLGNREADGYQVLTNGTFPRDERNKPTWSDAIATRMRLVNFVDGTIRWGSRRENYVCVIRKDRREKILLEQERLAADMFSKHVSKSADKGDEESARRAFERGAVDAPIDDSVVITKERIGSAPSNN
jgi:hypothetical protein